MVFKLSAIAQKCGFGIFRMAVLTTTIGRFKEKTSTLLREGPEHANMQVSP